jgi:beta-glucosidase/6-phospho-beta-glucosidase/beta-galactosidase
MGLKKDFLWGSATASYQCEGAVNELIMDTLNGVSLKETAAKINVNERNVFNMRHKLLVSLGTEERPIHSGK